MKQLNNHKLDKQHTLLVNLFTDFEKFESLSKEFEEPKSLDVQPVENLRDWLQDPRAADQYVIRFADRTEIYWNEQKGAQKADLAYSRDNWTDSSVQWYFDFDFVFDFDVFFWFVDFDLSLFWLFFS